MKTNLTKQTSKGELTIVAENGTATAFLNGKAVGTSGVIEAISIESNGIKYVGKICGFGLTASEVETVKAGLAIPKSDATGSRAQFIQAMREVRGDINQFKNS